MTLTNGDKDWIKKAVIDGVIEGINQVVIPKFEELEKDVKGLGVRMDRLDIRMDSVEAKVSSLEKAVWKVSDHQGKILDNHERRIIVLEEE